MRRTVASVASAAAGLLLLAGVSVVGAVPAAAAPAVTVPVGQVQAGEWWLAKLNIKQAWSASKQGAGVTVGVVDTGVDGSQTDLRGSVTGGRDFSGIGSANGQQPVATPGGTEPATHGTSVAGFIAARGHGAGNAQGMLGVAPRAGILTASISENSTRSVGAAVRWLADRGAKVVNISLSTEVAAADIAYAQQRDVVIVASSGNEGQRSLPQPALYPGVVAVSGIDENYASDPRSNYAKPMFPGGDFEAAPSQVSGGIAVAGPFADQNSQDAADGLVGMTVGGYERMSGTSFGSAVVAGVIALIRAAHPSMDADDAVNRLVRTARQLNPRGTGISDALGFGVPDANAAVTKSIAPACENILGSQASPTSNGVWPSVLTDKPYTPACKAATSSPPSSSGAALSAGSSQAALPPSSESSDGGVPGWVWPVVAVVVIAVAGGIVLAMRARRPAR